MRFFHQHLIPFTDFVNLVYYSDMNTIITLLQLALSLLLSVQQNPLLEQSLKDQAIGIANQAIVMANSALGQPDSLGSSTSSTTSTPILAIPERIVDLSVIDYSQKNNIPKLTFKFSDNEAGTFLNKQLIVKFQILSSDLSSIEKEYLIYDSSKNISDGISNPFVSEYTIFNLNFPHLSSYEFPKNETEIEKLKQRYFLTAFYDGNFYRTSIASYLNFEPIQECEQKVNEFLNDTTASYLIKMLPQNDNDINQSWERIRSNYSDFFTNNCGESFRYQELSGLINNYHSINDWIKAYR